MPMMYPPSDELRDRLVVWYSQHARTLPWREVVSPYRTLVSEIMLQQTRVDTVVPYFVRFMERWPRLEDLAAADMDEVLEAWAGLGYYRRARSLVAACQAAEALGGLPDSVEALKNLPGIGPYTAGAIASIAYGKPVAAVDGNVERVICRVDLRRGNPRKAPLKRALTARAEELSREGVASEVTQGLMELGATVCMPRVAHCERCPWQELCRAHAEGAALEVPELPKRKPPKAVSAVCVLLQHEGGLWFGERQPGLLGGLWGPPMSSLDGDVSGEAAARALVTEQGVIPSNVARVGKVTHVFTHRRLSLEVWTASFTGAPDVDVSQFVDARWVHPGVEQVAFSRLTEKILEACARNQEPMLPFEDHAQP